MLPQKVTLCDEVGAPLSTVVSGDIGTVGQGAPGGDPVNGSWFVKLVDISGNAVDATHPVPVVPAAATNQTAVGGPTAAAVVALFNGAARLFSFSVAYHGTGSVFILFHDAATATSPATGNMAGIIGIPISAVDPAQPWLFVELAVPIRFTNGCKVSVSSTQDTYTASNDTITVRGQWS